MKKLVIVGAQINLLVGDIEGNTQLIIDTAHRAYREHKADLVVFPELSITSYPPEDLLFRPALYRRVHQALQKIADDVKHTTVVVGYPDQIEGICYNKAAVIGDGKILATYAKQELPNYHVFDEKRYFVPGSDSCVFNLKGTKIGLLICEDLWFDGPVKQAVSDGAQLIVSLNASPFAMDKSNARVKILKNQAHYKIPIVYVNLVGGQDELVFDGNSMVLDQEGEVAQMAAHCKEDLLITEWDLENNLNLLTKKPFTALSEEEKIYRVLVLGVHDYIKKNHFRGAIIGLSGGIDSALTLAIAVDAIGAENVAAVMMPSRYTADISLEDAQAEAHALNVHYSIIDIEPIFKSFLNGLSAEFAGLPRDTTEENLQARIRGTLLMAISNKKGFIVLTTGNKSEMAVGYATLYGDMAGGFAVIKDVYKMMVYRLSVYRNTVAPVIPTRVIERAPSAELAPDQKDQDSLPPYPILDEILERYIAKDQDPATIADAGFDINIVKKVVRMINRNEYKRRQAPPGIRITERAFGKDRRYPITSGFQKDL